MKTCPNPKCKATGIPDEAKFCPNCGRLLSAEISIYSQWKINREYRLYESGNEYLLIYFRDKEITLNETAAFLWKKASGRISFSADTLARDLTEEYDVEYGVALRDVRLTIESWRNAGIINEL